MRTGYFWGASFAFAILSSGPAIAYEPENVGPCTISNPLCSPPATQQKQAGFSVSTPGAKYNEVTDNGLYFLTINAKLSRSADPLISGGFLTDKTSYLSLGIYFDTASSGDVVATGRSATTVIAIQPFSVTRTAAGAAGVQAVSINSEIQNQKFLFRGNLHSLRVELNSVEDQKPNEVKKAFDVFFYAPWTHQLSVECFNWNFF